MTAYEEFSQSRRSNRRMWNESVRFRVALVREERRRPAGISGHYDLLVRGLRTCLANRKAFKFCNEVA